MEPFQLYRVASGPVTLGPDYRIALHVNQYRPRAHNLDLLGEALQVRLVRGKIVLHFKTGELVGLERVEKRLHENLVRFDPPTSEREEKALQDSLAAEVDEVKEMFFGVAELNKQLEAEAEQAAARNAAADAEQKKAAAEQAAAEAERARAAEEAARREAEAASKAAAAAAEQQAERAAEREAEAAARAEAEAQAEADDADDDTTDKSKGKGKKAGGHGKHRGDE